MTGRIFSIEEFSTFDGPGIRTSVFLKGCPLKCLWCHNPEGQSFSKEYYRSPNGCLNCDNCLFEGKLKEESIAACNRNLVRVFGEDYTPEELAEKLLKNQRILNMNGGGITFSGGEPTSQGDFLLECLKLLKNKVHLCLQTCGFTNRFNDFLPHLDMVLYDLKIIDNDLHKKFCGVDNKIILENHRLLAESKKPFITRMPLITGITDTTDNLTNVALFLNENKVDYIELLPYNKLAGAKYKGLLRQYELVPDEKASCPHPVKIFSDFNITAKII